MTNPRYRVSCPARVRSASQTVPPAHRALRWVAASSMAVLLLAAGCGGGGLGSGGTGAPLGAGSGTITGFGSIVLDGVPFDDRSARVLTESTDGSAVLAGGELGQRVDFELDASGVPTTLRIDPQLVGPITDVQPLLRRIVVLGRTVQLNVNALEGPSTVLAGVADVSALAPGRWVEVHGVEGVAPLSGAPLLQATRIRALAVPAAALRISGRVDAVESGGSRLRIGGLAVDVAGARRVPEGFGIAVDDRVTVLARPTSLTVTPSLVLAADVLLSRPATASGQRVLLAGKVRSIDPGRSIGVEGVQILIGSATVSGGALQLGQYVRVEGLAVGTRQVQASAIGIRSGSSDGDIELKGTVVALAADGRSFQLRGTRVTVPLAGVQVDDCPAALTNGLYVEVRGTVEQDTVRATRIECSGSEPPGAVIEREGLASQVDPAARTLTLGSAGQRVLWSDLTLFRDVLPTVASLQGRELEVEGVLRADGVLLARRIRPAD